MENKTDFEKRYNNLYDLCATLMIKLIVYGERLALNDQENLNDIKRRLDNLLNENDKDYYFQLNTLDESLSNLFVKLEKSVLENVIKKYVNK